MMKKSLYFEIGALFIWMLFHIPGGPAAAAVQTGSGYRIQRLIIEEIQVIRLVDTKREIEVSIVPAGGNRAYEMKVRGANILFLPDAGASGFLEKVSRNGVPFMAPWANRLDGPGFWASGRRYNLDPDLGNYRKDGNGLPIHGLIMNSDLWQVVDAGTDRDSAFVTSRLEFWKYPDLLAQWPFAHTYEMTYRLSNGSLEIRITVSNLGAESMPLIIGFHPYFSIPDVPRERWLLHLPVRNHVVADERLIPTGQFSALDLPNPLPLKDRTLDHGFAGMIYGSEGRAVFSIKADEKRIDVIFGPKFPVAQVWLPAPPPGQTWDFICIEPMTGVTNGMNLNRAGKYPDLQVVPGYSSWTESFWIRPDGF